LKNYLFAVWFLQKSQFSADDKFIRFRREEYSFLWWHSTTKQVYTRLQQLKGYVTPSFLFNLLLLYKVFKQFFLPTW